MDDTQETNATQPHILWKQVAGLVFWITLVCLPAGGVVGATLGLIIGGVTFADAWLAGIRKDPTRKAFINMSPMGWGIAVSLLLIVGFPAYALNRNKLKTLPGNKALFGLVLAIGTLAFVGWVYSIYQLLLISY